MKCFDNSGENPMPDWEIHLRDAFGGVGEAVGGVTGLRDGVMALSTFLSAFPELAQYPLIAVRSSIAPPWSTLEGV